MKKTILYRLFKIGKIPDETHPMLEAEGIIVSDEGIGGWVITQNFRAPGKYHKYRMRGFSGALVITRKRVIAYAFKSRQINVLFDDSKISELEVVLINPQRIEISFDSSIFHDDWQGIIKLRFNTLKAKMFYAALVIRGVRLRENNAP